MKRYWHDLTATDFRNLAPGAIAVMPVAATEQHGPHLPVAVDCVIAEAMIARTLELLADTTRVVVLPVQAIGKSNEHASSPGTLTLSAETLIRAWTEIGESVHRAGIEKLVFVSSHGGNSEVMGIVARDLRVRRHMLAVTTTWMRFGLPESVTADPRHDIHAGEIETSLMLHFRPDLVDMAAAENFVPGSLAMERDFAELRVTGPASFAWMAQDVHASGAIGDAASASAETGRLIAEHQAARFAALLEDVGRFDLDRLSPNG